MSGLSGIVDRTYDRLSVRTINIYGCMDIQSRYRGGNSTGSSLTSASSIKNKIPELPLKNINNKCSPANNCVNVVIPCINQLTHPREGILLSW